LRKMDYTELREKVRLMIKPQRFIHSLGVAETAARLAERFGESTSDALIAGIYHDAYRYSATVDSILLLENAGFVLDDEEKREPMLLHGPLAAYHFESDAGEEVSDALKRAVRHHTLGSVEMGRLGGIIYIADYMEPGRRHLTDTDRREILSRSTIEAMVLDIIEREKPYLESTGGGLAEVTKELHSFLRDGGKL
jgi:predicted HD superfamily hydrolase involved in NAD metabolism